MACLSAKITPGSSLSASFVKSFLGSARTKHAALQTREINPIPIGKAAIIQLKKHKLGDTQGAVVNSAAHQMPIGPKEGYMYTYIILQEEQSLCFLKALQNIHFGQPRITFSSPFCVAGVGRSIITLF